MEKSITRSRAGVFFSYTGEKYYSSEKVVERHSVVHVISGEMKLVLPDKSYTFHAGDTILFPRNQLVKIMKYPAHGQPYRSVSIYFTQELLQKYYAQHPAGLALHGEPRVKVLDAHPLLDSLFSSLLPYFSLSDSLPADISTAKIEEAITILRTVDKDMDAVLGHFEEPGKIDLADFMEKNYTYNMPMEKFGYLTGRSLTTFKRDFKKAFHTTPQRWLTQKRLLQAHYEIFEKKRKPSEVYYEVGFENLSHFSFAFKKQFGYNPRG